MNTIDRVLVTMLTLSIICVGFVLENNLLQMHYDHLSIYSSTPQTPSPKHSDLARLQRIERAINNIPIRRNCSSYVDLKNIADVLTDKLSRMFEPNVTSITACDVCNASNPSIDEGLDDSENQDLDRSETSDEAVWETIRRWICWIGVWIYRLLLACVLGLAGFDALPNQFENKNGKVFCQTAVFMAVSCVGYFPHVLMDLCGSHCTAWYFLLSKGISRILWVMVVCFVNIGIHEMAIDRITRTKPKTQKLNILRYVFYSFLSVIAMYSGFHPTSIFI